LKTCDENGKIEDMKARKTSPKSAPARPEATLPKLSHELRLYGRTSLEIYEKFNNLVTGLGARGVKFRTKKLSAEAALSAIMAWFFDLPAESQAKIVQDNIARFEASLAGVPLAEGRSVAPTERQGASRPRAKDGRGG